ncbi:MAG: CsbD family protein [Cumulibacter sp.]
MSIGDKFKAKKDQLLGGAKEKVGDATGDQSTQAEGAAQQGKGDLREGVENLKDKAADAVSDVKDRLSGDGKN